MTGSLGKALAILDLFTEGAPGWRPDELMAATGYARPTLYRYLKALREAGLLASDSAGTLTLGPRVTELDYLARRADPLIREGRPALERLAARHPSSALLVRWYGEVLLCVDAAVSAPRPLSSYPRGRPMPLARGAISRAILAFLPRRKVLPILRANLAELSRHGIGPDEEGALEALREVRRDGVAVAHGEVTPGVVGVAAPVFDGGPIPVAALCVTSDAALAPAIPDIRRDVRAEARALSARLTVSEELKC